MKRLLATRLAGLELPTARGRLSVGADGAILFRTPPPAEAQGGQCCTRGRLSGGRR
jgi:hypothetical protein